MTTSKTTDETTITSKADRYIVLDCDIGSDDAWALCMLLRAEKIDTTPYGGPGRVKVIGVTCVQGNSDVHNGTRNALRVLSTMERLDVPVFKGCAVPLLPATFKRTSYFMGRDGLGDLEHATVDEVDEALICNEHAVNAMYRLACTHANEIDFLLIGPLTNFAMAINMYGDAFLSKIRNIYIMGGNYKGRGNITKCAEFNFMLDPEAAHVVLERSQQILRILPFETCYETCFDLEHPLDIKWRFEVIGAATNPFMELLNRTDRKLFANRKIWICCDAQLAAAYLFPKQIIQKSADYHATVELHGTYTRGQMVIDHLNVQPHNSTIICSIDAKVYRHVISWTAGLEGVELNSLLLSS